MLAQFGFGHGKVSLRVVEGTEGYKAGHLSNPESPLGVCRWLPNIYAFSLPELLRGFVFKVRYSPKALTPSTGMLLLIVFVGSGTEEHLHMHSATGGLPGVVLT